TVRTVPMTPEMQTALWQAIGTRTAGPVFLMPNRTSQHPPAIASQSMHELTGMFTAFLAGEQERIAAAGGTWSRAQQHRAARRGWKRLGGIWAQDIRRTYIRTMRRAGLHGRTCVKDFRHSWATTLQAAGADPFARRDMLGHTGLELTGQYTHTSVKTLKNEAARVRATRAVAITELQAALTY
ncbi:MAG: tyrosine-type recombinase/integrase, partial [Planctomycetota bacterium]